MMKTYNSIVIIFVCLLVGSCAGLIIWAQPLSGDLTRIGAHPERWYGWNAPQQKIPDLSNSPRSAFKKHLLVLGDSFSEIGHWQAYLDDRYSFTFVHTRNTSYHKILDKIRQENPDGVVIESVERFSYAMFGDTSEFMGNTAKNCDSISDTQATSATLNHPITLSYPIYNRKTFPSSAKEISQGFYLVKQHAFFAIKPKKQQAKLFDLTNDQLFSDIKHGKLLTLKSDLLLLPPLPDKAIPSMQCSMRTMAHALEQLKKPYVFMIVPDKTTAYQPYIVNTAVRNKNSVITQLLSHLGIPHTLDLLPDIRTALAQNEIDFYLPNDTHWGYKGFYLAAQKIEAALQPQWQAEQP